MKFQLLIKQIFDFIASLIGIIILLPLFLILTILIKANSRGPVFFLQERLGKKGKIFKIIKFRTMIVDAEKIGDGLTVKSETDTRITKVGQFLRLTSLDELPQLFNVVKGEMSLVGPRPPVTYHPYNGYDAYPEWAKKRFGMKPGITGLAQVTVRNSVSWDERIKVDNRYIENYSLINDVKILFQTIKKIVKPDSIYLKGE
ncbi:sugar transferase [Carnobacteriaceae bacterium 52-44]